MTPKEYLKAELMLYALENDYFAYGTLVTKLKNGKYKVIAEGETYYHTLHSLVEEFDLVDDDCKRDIVKDYYNEELSIQSL